MRNTILLVSIGAFAFVPLAVHAQNASAQTPPTEDQRVLAIEDEYVAAEVSRDEATLRRIVDDRFLFNSNTGTTTGKEDFIQSVLKMSMVGQTISERSVVIEGEIALVFGTAELRFVVPGKDESVSVLRYTSTYVKRDGEWRLLALQMQKRIPD